MYVGFQFHFISFYLEFFLLIPSRFSIGGDILAAPGRMQHYTGHTPFLLFCVELQRYQQTIPQCDCTKKSDITQACNKCDCPGMCVCACVCVCADAAFSLWCVPRHSHYNCHSLSFTSFPRSALPNYRRGLRVYFHWYSQKLTEASRNLISALFSFQVVFADLLLLVMVVLFFFFPTLSILAHLARRWGGLQGLEMCISGCFLQHWMGWK